MTMRVILVCKVVKHLPYESEKLSKRIDQMVLCGSNYCALGFLGLNLLKTCTGYILKFSKIVFSDKMRLRIILCRCIY